MTTPYEVVTADVAEQAGEVLRLWSDSFEVLRGEAAEHKLARDYIDNPAGSGLLYLLRDGRSGGVVGVQCLVLRRFFDRGRVLLAGTMADYVVDAGHRSLGPALMLLRGCIEGSRSALAFVYGLPNRKSESILRRAGMQPVAQLGRYAALLRTRQYFAGRLPRPLLGVAAWLGDIGLRAADSLRTRRLGGRLRWHGYDAGTAALSADLDNIWQAVLPELMLSERSAAMLQWRFGPATASSRSESTSTPESTLTTGAPGGWQVVVASADDIPLGYVVWRSEGAKVVIGDFLCRAPAAQTAHLLGSFRQYARARGLQAITLEFSGCDAVVRALGRAGFWLRDSQPIYGVGHARLPGVDSWYVTSFDRDAD